MKVVEIFDSIDGEGIRTGQLATFIRLAGCNLRCGYCDTTYALFGEKEKCVYEEMSVNDILKKVNKNFMRVTLTGGEPLIHENVGELIEGLCDMGCEVNIETNGAADITKVPKNDNLFFTIDYKLKSSGMSDKMLWNNFLNLTEKDVIKFVCGSDEDITRMIDIVKKLKEHYTKMPHIYIGAVYGKVEYKDLVEVMMREPVIYDATFQIQLHKVIWNPDERGV